MTSFIRYETRILYCGSFQPKGKSIIHNIEQIDERGYENIDGRLKAL